MLNLEESAIVTAPTIAENVLAYHGMALTSGQAGLGFGIKMEMTGLRSNAIVERASASA